VRIEILAENTQTHMSWASGFFCKWEDRFYLVTNWHVVSGRNFQSGEILNRHGAIPGFFNLHFHCVERTGANRMRSAEVVRTTFPLYKLENVKGEDIYTDPLWIEHPIHKRKIDVVAIDITDDFIQLGKEVLAYDIEEELKKQVNLKIMDDVFITGYPLNTSTTPNKFPIYKGATIASEPDFYKDLPIFYVDGKTKKGMSGSPVIRKDNNFRDTSSVNEIPFTQGVTEFIGVYSGRARQEIDEYSAELGIVWRYKECLIPLLKIAYSNI